MKLRCIKGTPAGSVIKGKVYIVSYMLKKLWGGYVLTDKFESAHLVIINTIDRRNVSLKASRFEKVKKEMIRIPRKDIKEAIKFLTFPNSSEHSDRVELIKKLGKYLKK